MKLVLDLQEILSSLRIGRKKTVLNFTVVNIVKFRGISESITKADKHDVASLS